MSTEQLRIHVEQFPNAELREYHLSRLTYSKPWSKYDDKGVPKKIQALSRKFERLPEIKTDTVLDIVYMKSLCISRNPVFTWDEVHVAVMAVIAQYFKVDVATIGLTMPARNPEWDIPRKFDFEEN